MRVNRLPQRLRHACLCPRGIQRTLAVTVRHSSSSSSPSDVTASEEEVAAVPRELRAYSVFLRSEEDLDYALLTEAHRKHGVWLNVPPQRPPSIPHVGPPAIPDVIICEAQLRRMQSAGSAYAPTHEPPPLHTTGTRALTISDSYTPVAAAKSADTEAVASNSKKVPARAGVVMRQTTVIKRAPVDDSMQFHCSACGKAFRKESTAEEHVRQRHARLAGGVNDPNAHMVISSVKATVVAGPGPGEAIGSEEVMSAETAAAPPAPATTKVKVSDAGSSGAESTKAEEASKTAPTTMSLSKVPSTKIVATIPDDDLIESLLIEVWDAVGLSRSDIVKPPNLPLDPQNALRVVKPAAGSDGSKIVWDSKGGEFFIPAGLVVEGQADRRAELAALQASKPLSRATPTNAAPGIKRRLSNVSLPTGASSGIQSIKELSKQYPNPFGDSPNAAVVELEKEPVNPFIDLENAVTSSATPRTEADAVFDLKPMTTSAERKESRLRLAQARPFVCPFCRGADAAGSDENPDAAAGAVAFRLLDGLLDHIEDAHSSETLSEEQWRSLYATQADGGRQHGEKKAKQDSVSKDGEAAQAGIEDATATATANGSDDKTSEILPEDVHVHARSAVNTVLVGTVRDIQDGYLNTTRVLQYVVGVRAPIDMVSSNDGDGSDDIEELFVVRCETGGSDALSASLLQRSLHIGASVYVQGSLRMNRQVDAASRRLHAYPYIKVAPPMGSIVALK